MQVLRDVELINHVLPSEQRRATAELGRNHPFKDLNWKAGATRQEEQR